MTCFAFWTLVDKSVSLYTIGASAAALAFVMNHPHFLSSYMLLYWDHRAEIFKKPKFLWASIIAPILLIGALASSMLSKDPIIMGHIVTAMFFFVGWHYVKQIFGCVIVSSVHRRIFYSLKERRTILFCLYSIWFFNWVKSHIGHSTFDFYGIKHYSLGLPEGLHTAGFWFVGISVCAVIGLHIKKYLHQGIIPAPPAVIAFASLLVWYLPMFSHPAYNYLIPFFHSMQYLVFVLVYKKNETAIHNINKPEPEQRKAWMHKFVGYMLMATFLGSVFFEWLPKSLDQYFPLEGDAMGSAPWLACFLLFINIHHYFIDNVIWRSDNASVKKFLFATAATEEKPKSWAKSA